jgi:hypothetical protein
MKNNIFSFQDAYWQQLAGTAMGTPVACAYATVTHGHFENSDILPTFSSNLLYYRRFIDDVFRIWIPSTTGNDLETWEAFMKKLNNWGALEWVIEEPSKKTNFLDLTLQISDSKIVTETYQKDMNLYLYIPAASAHPPSCLKGPITGEMHRYWMQNNTKDFQEILSKLIQHLTERGHSLDNLIPLLCHTAAILDSSAASTTRQANDDQTLYLHWQYHPKGIQ